VGLVAAAGPLVTRDEEIRQAEAHDHARAGERGERCLRIANAVVDAINGRGLLRDPRAARIVAFHTIADHLYGNVAIDVPVRLGEP
jgi:NAD(P)H-hydrate repair Nnr-like enzyme with NAD(P)H-hydrate epimerase domain